jgi:hypothetical protein
MDAVSLALFLPVSVSFPFSTLPRIHPSTVEPLQTYAIALSPWTATATDPPPPPTRPTKSALVGVVLVGAGEGAAAGADCAGSADCSGDSEDSAGAGDEGAGAAEDAAAVE